MESDGLFVSSRGMSISIAVPGSIQAGLIDQVGKGSGSFDRRCITMPIGHHPLVRHSMRCRNFSAPRSMPGLIGTVGSGQINSRYELRNSAATDAVPCPSCLLTVGPI